MTTIVFDSKAMQIAIDSRCTSGGLIVSDSEQKFRLDEDVNMWFMCGVTCDFDLLIECFKCGDRALDLPSIPDASAFLVRGGKVFLRGVSGNGEAWTQSIMHNRAIGSGSSFAIAALDFGKTAKEAVEYAATRDVYTGGKVHVYNVITQEFED